MDKLQKVQAILTDVLEQSTDSKLSEKIAETIKLLDDFVHEEEELIQSLFDGMPDCGYYDDQPKMGDEEYNSIMKAFGFGPK